MGFAHLPMPLTEQDQQARYCHRLSIWQVEVGRTPVFDDPVHGRAFFEAVIKENRALRTETTLNDPKGFGVRMDILNLSFLQQIGREINRRLLDVQRVSHNCHLSQESVERVVQPTLTHDGQRAPGLRFGQAWTMALLGALTLFVYNSYGFRHHDLLPQVADLLGLDDSTHQLTYDLRRLCLKGMIWRVPNSHRYLITPYGCKVSLFFT